MSAPALVTGGTGVVGAFLLPRLLEAGFTPRALSRRPSSPARQGVEWETGDLEKGWPGSCEGARHLPAVLFHAAPLWLLPANLKPLARAGVTRVVAFGSTSRHSKAHSPDPGERATAERLARAEEGVASSSARLGIEYTLLRPTLVYGGGRDRNVSEIARVVRLLGFFPTAGRASGRRQPVHAGDLADACVAVVDNPATFGRTYDLTGGTTLTFAEMVSTISRGLGRRPRLPRLPIPVARAALALAGLVPGFRHASPAMADRMNEDLVFDSGPARRDFGYSPRPFRFPDERSSC